MLELVGLTDKLFERAERFPAASSNAHPWPARSTTTAQSSSATSRCRRSTACKARMLGKLCARHDTAILAMHDIPLALAHADRVVVLDEGRIVLDAPARLISAVDLVQYYGG